nr:hypothetical protein Itr_chr01CG08610 [Ipomoea trifida]
MKTDLLDSSQPPGRSEDFIWEEVGGRRTTVAASIGGRRAAGLITTTVAASIAAVDFDRGRFTDLLASLPLSWQRSNQQIFRPSPPSLPSTVRDKASVFSADQQIFSTLSSSVPPRTPPLPPPLSRRQVFQPSIVHRHSSSVSLSSPLLAENFPQLA